MKKFNLLLICLAILTPVSGCSMGITPSRNIVVRDVSASDFSSIEVVGSPTVEYTQSGDGTTKVYISGPDNVVDLLDVTFSGGKMKVAYKPNTKITGRNELKVVASSPVLENAFVSGSGDIIIKGRLKGKDLEMKVSGSGDIMAENLAVDRIVASVNGSGDVDVKKCECSLFTASVNGSGDVNARGNTSRAVLRVAGSGDITADKLKAARVEAEIAGSGDISCYASENLEGKASGSGTITYYGNPPVSDIKGRKDNFKKK